MTLFDRGTLLALVLLPWAAPASAESAADFYRGKTLTYIVATKPGGGYDTYARLIAEFLERHLPTTRVQVKNVPGAGHIIGANKLFAAEPDGLTIGSFNTGLIYSQLVGRKGIRFDLRKLSWIGKAAGEPRVAVLGKNSGFGSLEDLRRAQTPILFGTSGVGSASHNETIMLGRALGLKLKPVVGYAGDGAQMGVLRGELAGALGSLSSYRPFVDNGYGRIVFRVGGDPALGPDAADLAIDDSGRALVALIRAQSELGRLTAAPPGVPADRLRVLRQAYRAALDDPDLRARAGKLKIPLNPLFGKDVARRVAGALEQNAETLALLASVMNLKPPAVSSSGRLKAVGSKGKTVTLDSMGRDLTIKISGSRSRVRIAGARADRKDLRVGMNCTLAHASGEASRIDCER